MQSVEISPIYEVYLTHHVHFSIFQVGSWINGATKELSISLRMLHDGRIFWSFVFVGHISCVYALGFIYWTFRHIGILLWDIDVLLFHLFGICRNVLLSCIYGNCCIVLKSFKLTFLFECIF